MSKKQKCLNCNKVAFVRGVCGTCYQAARTAVQRGDTSWNELYKAGLIRKPVTNGPKANSGFARRFAALKK